MTEYSKKIFSDKVLLREKMTIFLGDNSNLNCVEDYARAAELFFATGLKNELKFAPTWSWWAFLGGFWFLLYRKCYAPAVLFLFLSLLPLVNILVLAVCGACGKYFVVRRFERFLDCESDELLAVGGGKNAWTIFVFAILSVLTALILAFGAFSLNLNYNSNLDFNSNLKASDEESKAISQVKNVEIQEDDFGGVLPQIDPSVFERKITRKDPAKMNRAEALAESSNDLNTVITELEAYYLQHGKFGANFAAMSSVPLAEDKESGAILPVKGKKCVEFKFDRAKAALVIKKGADAGDEICEEFYALNAVKAVMGERVMAGAEFRKE